MASGAVRQTLAPSELPPEISAQLGDEERRVARRCFTLLGILGTCAIAGSVWSLYLVNHFPLTLIALSPIGRHLVLVAPTVNPLAFVLVGVARRLAFFTGCFHLGRSLGPWGLVWLESRAERMGRFVRWLERLFQRAPRLAVFFLQGPGMSTIAGISGMPTRTWLPLVIGGLFLRIIALLLFGEWLREPILGLLAWIDRWWMEGTALILLGVAAYQWRRTRRRRAAAPASAALR